MSVATRLRSLDRRQSTAYGFVNPVRDRRTLPATPGRAHGGRAARSPRRASPPRSPPARGGSRAARGARAAADHHVRRFTREPAARNPHLHDVEARCDDIEHGRHARPRRTRRLDAEAALPLCGASRRPRLDPGRRPQDGSQVASRAGPTQIHGDHDIGAHGTRKRDRHRIHQAAIDEHAPSRTAGVKRAGNASDARTASTVDPLRSQTSRRSESAVATAPNRTGSSPIGRSAKLLAQSR